jgi:hypothetical protein
MEPVVRTGDAVHRGRYVVVWSGRLGLGPNEQGRRVDEVLRTAFSTSGSSFSVRWVSSVDAIECLRQCAAALPIGAPGSVLATIDGTHGVNSIELEVQSSCWTSPQLVELAQRIETAFHELALPDGGAVFDALAAHVRPLLGRFRAPPTRPLARLLSFHWTESSHGTRLHTHGLVKFAGAELDLALPTDMSIADACAALERWATESATLRPLGEGRQLFGGERPFVVRPADDESRAVGAGFIITENVSSRRVYFDASHY